MLNGWAPARGGSDSLAAQTPADVGLFIEARNVGDLLLPLTEPVLWTTLAELAGQPSRPEDVAAWRRQIRATVGMEPGEAIRKLFSRRVGFAGEGPGRAQDAVVMCEPAPDVNIAELLASWKAQRIEEIAGPPVYRLGTNIGVAELDRLLVFGDLTPKSGTLRRVLEFQAAGRPKTLAEDPDFKALLARVPEKPDALLFARLGRHPLFAAATQPAAESQAASAPVRAAAPLPELPGPLRGATVCLLALHREGPRLHVTAVGDALPPRPSGEPVERPLVLSLPARTLAAWEGRVDFVGGLRAVRGLPERHALRVLLDLQQYSDVAERLVGSLGSQVCTTVGVIAPPGRAADAPPLPAVAMVVAASEAATAGEAFRTMVVSTASAYSIYAASRGKPALPPVRSTPGPGGTTIEILDLTSKLPAQSASSVGEVHVCWTVDRDVLIVGTHAEWLRQIVAARRGEGATIAGRFAGLRQPIPPGSETIVLMESSAIARLGELWLDYFERYVPEILSEDWWRTRQPGGGGARLGIDVVEDTERRVLRVVSVERHGPSDGFLRVGDELVGCNERRFATTQPISEIRAALQNRPQARWVSLLVQREGALIVARVPLPFVDPIQTLRRAAAIGRLTHRVIYFDDAPDVAGGRGFLTLEMKTATSERFEFPTTAGPQPVGTSQPAGDRGQAGDGG